MGCDIHAFIEWRSKTSVHWRPFSAQLCLGRHYGVFGRMAGVRSSHPDSFLPRGIPNDLAYEADDEWWLYITDDETTDEHTCTRQQARLWHEHGRKYKANHEGVATWVEHPDWHTPSWLTYDEFRKAAIDLPGDWSNDPDYAAAGAAMAELERHGMETRIVFWFDN